MTKLRWHRPVIYHIIEERKEQGGFAWVLSAKQFDKLFHRLDVWEREGKVWGVLSLAGENIKVYRDD